MSCEHKTIHRDPDNKMQCEACPGVLDVVPIDWCGDTIRRADGEWPIMRPKGASAFEHTRRADQGKRWRPGRTKRPTAEPTKGPGAGCSHNVMFNPPDPGRRDRIVSAWCNAKDACFRGAPAVVLAEPEGGSKWDNSHQGAPVLRLIRPGSPTWRRREGPIDPSFPDVEPMDGDTYDLVDGSG